MRATIVIPTTGNRAQLVEQALWSIRRQTVQDFEVFVIGDGVADPSRARLAEFCAEDPRVKFFDHPKHPRRGEDYRHAALAAAAGEIVCYMCDRDLYLPWHLEEMGKALAKNDFAGALPVLVLEDDSMALKFRGSLNAARTRKRIADTLLRGTPLSCGAHRLDSYRKLPVGWAETPGRIPTDTHMWAKFLGREDFRCTSIPIPTVIYLPRGRHPGWPADKRLGEMLRWRAKMEEPGFDAAFLRAVCETVESSRAEWSNHPIWRAWHEFLEQQRALASRYKQGLRVRLVDALLAASPITRIRKNSRSVPDLE